MLKRSQPRRLAVPSPLEADAPPAVSPGAREATARPATAGPIARTVPAVERAIALLDALATASQPQSLAALARSLSLPKSSVHGLLATLAAAGLARRNADGGRWK